MTNILQILPQQAAPAAPVDNDADDGATTESQRRVHAGLVVIPDVTESSDEVNDISQAQNKRLRQQANTILFWLRRRHEQLTLMIEYFDRNNTHTMRDFYATYPEQTIESLVRKTCQRGRLASKTFYKWRKQFVLHGKFDRDERGLSQFGWILVNEDKKAELTFWLQSQKEISVRDSRDWINNHLLADIPVGRVHEYGRLKRPIVPSTAHRWMLLCNAKYEPVTQTYVTSAHQRHDTLLYRTWFCDLDYFLSLRMHRWVCFSRDTLLKLKAHYGDEWPSDSLSHKIPVEDVGQFPPGKNHT